MLTALFPSPIYSPHEYGEEFTLIFPVGLVKPFLTLSRGERPLCCRGNCGGPLQPNQWKQATKEVCCAAASSENPDRASDTVAEKRAARQRGIGYAQRPSSTENLSENLLRLATFPAGTSPLGGSLQRFHGVRPSYAPFTFRHCNSDRRCLK